MSANPRDRESTTSPADELFYKGKLLLPRLQMVRKLLQSSTAPPHVKKPPDAFEEKMATLTPSTTATNTPFESCSISPAYRARSIESKQVSVQEAQVDRPLVSGSQAQGIASLPQVFLHQIKQSCALPKAEECSNGHAKAGKRKPFGQIQRERYNNSAAAALMRSIHGGKPNEEELGHRKYFSGIIRWNYLTTKSSSCSSSSSNASSNGYSLQPQILKRSSSVNSEAESSIQGAIAYCNKSQQLVCARKSANGVGYYSVCF